MGVAGRGPGLVRQGRGGPRIARGERRMKTEGKGTEGNGKEKWMLGPRGGQQEELDGRRVKDVVTGGRSRDRN